MVLAGLVAGLGLGLTGCAKFDAALGQQQVIVSFRDGTTTAQRVAIRAACASMPGTSPQALPDLKKYPYALEQLTFTITKATSAQVVALENCLQKFPSVTGVSQQDASDEGG